MDQAADILGRNWMVLMLFILFGIMAWLRYMYSSKIDKIFQATFNERLTRQMMREEGVLGDRVSIVLLILFSASLAFHFYFAGIIGARAWTPEDIRPYFAILLGIIGFSLLHWALHMTFRFLLEDSYGIREYVFTISLINRTCTFILLPLALLMAFVGELLLEPVLWISLVVLITIIGYRFYRGFRITFEHKVKPVYFIFYLCTLEVLPILLVLKALSEQVFIT